jgi:hypothetical protein
MNTQTEQKPIDAQLEVLPPAALESMERAQIDVQIATAHRYPRSIEMFKKQAISLVTQDAATAEECIYSRPVGGGKVAEGCSIRLAEVVASCYSNLRVGARVIEQTDRWVKCEGFCHDLQNNVASKSEVIESTVDKEGRPFSERMRVVVAKAALSKARRDAILTIVPRAICKPIIEAAKAVIRGDNQTVDQRQKKVKEWLRQIKVDEARVFAVLGVKGWSEVGVEQLETLTGLRTAINDNETNPEESFPRVSKPAATNAPPQEPAKESEPAKSESQQQITEPIKRVQSLMAESGVNEEAVLAHLKTLRLIKSSIQEIIQLADSTLTRIADDWQKLLPAIKEVAAKQ